MSLSPNTLNRFNILWMNFSSEKCVGSEMMGKHFTIIFSENSFSTKLNSFFHSPLTSQFYKKKDKKKKVKKTILIVVPLERTSFGSKEEGLILTCQLDSICISEFLDRINENKASERVRDALTDKVKQNECRLALSQLLLDQVPDVRPEFTINHYNLRRGSLVKLRGNDGKERFWIIVSSSLWLSLLNAFHHHTKRPSGFIRDIIHVVPIFEFPSDFKEFSVSIDPIKPTLPEQCNCRPHMLRTRSLERIVSIHGAINQSYLDQIDFCLKCFLGL